MMEEVICENQNNKEYLIVLKSLNEIPFPVGRKLLGDFLEGDMTHKSILKNDLYDLHNFAELRNLSRFKINEMIDDLISKKLIDLSSTTYNKFVKVLSLSRRGSEELKNPKLNSKKVSNNYCEVKTEIGEGDLKNFEEYNAFLRGLNLEQKKAVISKNKKILCIAGAGSGKTTVLTKRVEFLSKKKGINPSKILAITFTRKARIAMAQRLKVLGIQCSVETFNSFCEKILINNSEKIYGRNMRVANYQDKINAITLALTQLNISIQDAIQDYFSESQIKNKNGFQLQNMFMNDCFSVLEFYKATKKDLEDFSSGLNGKDYVNAKMIYDIVLFLKEYMQKKGLRTYTDQINDCLDYFKNNKDSVPNFEHVLVDEYQDVNSSQVELIDLLGTQNLFFVGDPRQSIFGWRGSEVNYILDLIKNENIEIINLRKNYRSNKYIVDLMNHCIRELKMEDLESNFEGVRQIKLCNFANEQVEMDFISKKVLLSNVSRKNIFILARTNRQLIAMSNELNKKGILHILKNDDSKDVESNEGEVTLATIHSIKGLEAEEVYVVGCTKKNFPCKATEHPVMELIKMYEYDREEEERRLFYVAISRAKNKLFMTYSGKDHTYFINEEMKDQIDIINY